MPLHAVNPFVFYGGVTVSTTVLLYAAYKFGKLTDRVETLDRQVQAMARDLKQVLAGKWSVL
jgi:DNA-binding MurR/RpiR family transcriptional regulator